MIARTVFVVFCAIIQVASCQGDDDTIINLEELITETFNEVNNYALNIQFAYYIFYQERSNDIDSIDFVRNRTKYQLMDLASTLNQNNYDISDCLMVALKNVSNTVYETRRKLELLNVLTIDRDLLNSDYVTLQQELDGFFKKLRLLNGDCMILGNVDEVNLCISELITELNDEIETAKRRIDEVEPVLAANVEEVRGTQREYMDEFEVSIQNTIEATEQELTACINTL